MDLTSENIIHVKKNGIEYLQFKKMLEYGIVNCYTTRTNNFSYAGNMDENEMKENYKKISDCLQIKVESIVRPKQAHTDVIMKVDSLGGEYKDVDGLITNKPGINLMLTFADCTPILIYDPVKKAIGNIHSGWKGTVQKIAQKAVLKMQNDYASNPKDLIVCIGPCIKKCHFEVKNDVKNIFEEKFSYLNRNQDIIKTKEGQAEKYLIDTSLVNRLILEEVGVQAENIIDSGICTVCHSDIIHSYRKDGDKSGRNVAILGMQ